MDTPHPLSRRHLLGRCGAVVALGTLAGCVGGDDSGDTGSDDVEGDGSDPDDSENGNEDSEPSLDRREANVVGVSVERREGTHRFDVTLHHDDDGEEGYANWWQIERLDGSRLGRRDLLHAHSQQPFTRSESVEIPETVGCVVVRGHDQTHGYGGRVILLNLDSGECRTVDQGSDVRLFDAGDCPG